MPYNLLQGKKGIIFGALDEKSIAWKTALRCHEEGAQIVLSNAPVALRMGEINKLAEMVQAPVIGADVVKMDDLKKLFEE
ncbi:MAG TPA: SDR family oxidoreductase, partial [Chitinophagaceae bacterium]|nr:SDR family oxidoreductase [Chitinophagaceae bacterium]